MNIDRLGSGDYEFLVEELGKRGFKSNSSYYIWFEKDIPENSGVANKITQKYKPDTFIPEYRFVMLARTAYGELYLKSGIMGNYHTYRTRKYNDHREDLERVICYKNNNVKDILDEFFHWLDKRGE